MNAMERAALQHAAAWKAYERSPQYRIDLAREQTTRAAADRKAGHLPTCGLLQCQPDCPSLRR